MGSHELGFRRAVRQSQRFAADGDRPTGDMTLLISALCDNAAMRSD
jgi:hypothetical protein